MLYIAPISSLNFMSLLSGKYDIAKTQRSCCHLPYGKSVADTTRVIGKQIYTFLLDVSSSFKSIPREENNVVCEAKRQAERDIVFNLEIEKEERIGPEIEKKKVYYIFRIKLCK